METRSYELRSVNEEAREVTGLAVPYGSVTNVGGYQESFERGAIEDASETLLFWNHQEPIGRVVRGEETEEGFVITAVISETTRGNEAYTLLRDGVIKKFSVGFMPVEHRMDGEVLVRTKINLKEVSLVPFPAYERANVTHVRNEVPEEGQSISEVRDAKSNEMKGDIIMSNEIENTEVAELRESVTDLERRFAMLGETQTSATANTQYRSGGEFLKALVDAPEQARAYTGAVLADADGSTRPAWVSKALRLVDENRPVINSFSRAALPASGNSIEYPFVSNTSGTVAKQSAEGVDLPYMEVQLDTATASVHTYGGYSSLSRQAIERSDLSYLETVLRYQTLQYAKATEAAVRTALTTNANLNEGELGGADAIDWIEAVVDAAKAIDDDGLGASADFIMVSHDVFKRMALLVDGQGRPLFVLNGDGSNTVGDVNLRGVSGSMAGLPIKVGKGLSSGSMYVASREALTTYESAGAPFHLQDENIINLTKDFSLYGYMAVAVTNPLAIVKVDVDGVDSPGSP